MNNSHSPLKALLHSFTALVFMALLTACGGGGGGGGGDDGGGGVIPPSSDATLSDLVISAGGLDPIFGPNQFAYTATVGFSTTETTVTPTTTQATATVMVNGVAVPSGNPSDPIPLDEGDNAITVLVTAEDGITTNTYTITVTRESNATLSDLSISAGSLDQIFQPNQFDYTATVGFLTTETTVTATTADAAATVTVNGTAVTSGSPSDPIPLNEGNNLITVIVTGADGTTTNTYTLTVTRQPANAFAQQAYIKASNTDSGDQFGFSVAASGETLAVGAYREDSNATGVNGNQDDNSLTDPGAVYVVTRSGTVWSQQAYIKASNTDGQDWFGSSVALSGDTLAVGAYREASQATGINGDQADNSLDNAGAVYVFTRSGTEWSQQAYIKASNTDSGDFFGKSVALSGDTLVVGAHQEASNATGIDGDQADDSLSNAGAVYVFTRSGTEWSQQAYIKASNTGSDDNFGYSVTLAGDTLAVGAYGEASNATGVDGNQTDNSRTNAGAVYVFTRSDTEWSQQAYIKASNTDSGDFFGWSSALSADTLAVGANGEASNATGIGGNQGDNSAPFSGAVYVFTRSGTEWSQQAYIKASNTESGDRFSWAIALSGDTLAAGADREDSNATGIDGDQTDNSLADAGAVYLFNRNADVWSQQAYVKASNSDNGDFFGSSVALSGDTVNSGAPGEDSNATGVDGDQTDNSFSGAGAVYCFQ